jgi:hypothetical protein
VSQLQEPQSDAIALIAKQLEPAEKAFVDILVRDEQFNIQRAAREAGFEGANAGDRLLKKQAVQRYLCLIQADRRERHRDIRDQVIQALWQLAAGWDVGAMVDDAGQPLPPDRLPPALRAAVKGAKIGREGWEYTFVDRAAILTILLRHFGETDGHSGLSDMPSNRPRRVIYDE